MKSAKQDQTSSSAQSLHISVFQCPMPTFGVCLCCMFFNDVFEADLLSPTHSLLHTLELCIFWHLFFMLYFTL